MADGSVIIAAQLDTAPFLAQVNALEGSLASLAGRMEAQVAAAVASSGVDTAMAAIANAIGTSLVGMSETAAQAGVTAANAAVTGYASGDFTGVGTASGMALLGGFSGGASGLSAVAADLAAKVHAAFSGNWFGVGAAMMQGVAEGVRAAGAEVVAAIVAVSNEVMAATKDFYEIASPSAKMRDEVGVMLSRGMAEGISDGGSYIREALAEMYALSQTPVRSVEVGGTGGSVVQYITLRQNDPTPYETARAIRRESEALLRS